MSGLTQRNQAGQSGLVAPKVDFQRITTSASPGWTKPGDVSVVWIEAIGGGGGGGGGFGTNLDANGGGGGGGGALAWACYSADALPATLDVIVGAVGTAGGANANGVAGGDSEVHVSAGLTEAGKVLLKAWGGGGGGAGPNRAAGSGDGG